MYSYQLIVMNNNRTIFVPSFPCISFSFFVFQTQIFFFWSMFKYYPLTFFFFLGLVTICFLHPFGIVDNRFLVVKSKQELKLGVVMIKSRKAISDGGYVRNI